MTERARGVLAFLGACLIVACVGLYEWPLALGVTGAILFAFALRPEPKDK